MAARRVASMARLMTTARAGEILLSGHVQKATANDFVFEPRTPLPMKGKAEPLPVFAVTGERQHRAIRLQEPTYALPMAGRTHELQMINDTLELALHAKGQVIGIVAEAGMGKSRLAAEVIRNARKRASRGMAAPVNRMRSIRPINHGNPFGRRSLMLTRLRHCENKSVCLKERSKTAHLNGCKPCRCWVCY